MKKIFALILAIVMMASMSVVVFAADNPASENVGKADTDASGNLGGTVLTYGVSETYTVTIPADQDFEKNGDVTGAKAFKAEADIAASEVKIKGNQTLVVSVASKNTWKLVDATGASTAVAYTAHVDDAEAALVNEGAVLTINVLATSPVEGESDDATLNFYTAGTAQVGNYQDTLTFKVAIS